MGFDISQIAQKTGEVAWVAYEALEGKFAAVEMCTGFHITCRWAALILRVWLVPGHQIPVEAGLVFYHAMISPTVVCSEATPYAVGSWRPHHSWRIGVVSV